MCRPWTTYTPWTVVFCDYSLGDIYEGFSGIVCDAFGLLCQPGRGFYDDDPPDEGVWTRWCWLDPVDGVVACKWGGGFHQESVSQVGVGEGGIVRDPPEPPNSFAYAVLIVPPLTDEIVMQCGWYGRATVVTGTGSATAQGGVTAAGGTAIEGGPEGGTYLIGVSSVGEEVVEGSGVVTLSRSGSHFSSVHPTSYEDHVLYPRWRLNTQAFSLSSGSAESHVYQFCDVMSIRIADVVVIPSNEHLLAEELGIGILPPGFEWPSFEWPVGPVLDPSAVFTLDYGIEIGETECYGIYPEFSFSETVLGFPIDMGWAGGQLCTREYEIEGRLGDFNVLFVVLSMAVAAGVFVVYKVFRG